MKLKNRTNNERMCVFIDILVTIFESEIKFANTKSWPLLPYQTLMQRNLFKTECMEFIKHYNISWNSSKICPDKVKHEYVRDKNRSQKIFESFIQCLLEIKQKLLSPNPSNMNNNTFPIYKVNGLMNPMKVHGLKYEQTMKLRMRLKMPTSTSMQMRARSGQTMNSNMECGGDKKQKSGNDLPFIKNEYDKYPSFHKFKDETTTSTNYSHNNHLYSSAMKPMSFIPSPMKIDPINTMSFPSNHSMFLKTRNNERVIIPKQNNQSVSNYIGNNNESEYNDQNLTKMCQILLEQFMNNNNQNNTNYIDNTLIPPSTVNFNTFNNINISNFNNNGYNPSNSPQSISPQQIIGDINLNLNVNGDKKDNYINKMKLNNNHLSDFQGINANHIGISNEPLLKLNNLNRSNQQINWNGFGNVNLNPSKSDNQQTQCNMNIDHVQSTLSQISNNNSSPRNNLNINNNITSTPTTTIKPVKETLTVRYQILSLGPGTTPIVVNSSIVN